MKALGAFVLLLFGARATHAQVTPRVFPDERPVDTKLYMAIKAGDAAKVRFFLGKGADPNANYADGWRPLLELDGTDEQRLAVAKILVAKGAEVNYRQPGQGWTPLFYNLTGGFYPKLADFLISRGANVNIPTSDGSTALHEAVRDGSIEAVRLLLANGANVHARTHSLNTKMDWPMPRSAGAQAREDARSAQQTALYLEPGFKRSGQTPIFELGFRWSDPIADLLLHAGARLDETDDNGWTLLHHTVSNANLEGITSLLKRGLNPNAASKAGFRPLHVAMRAGLGAPFEPGINLLIKAGGNLSLRNNAHQTPIELLRADLTTRFTQLLSEGDDLDQQSKDYFAAVNNLILKYDPSGKPVGMPSLPVDALGTHYADLDFEDFTIKRSVRNEHGRLVLDLVFEGFPVGATFFTIDDARLGGAAPMTPMPIRLKRESYAGQHILIKFPFDKAKGRRVGFKYRSSGPHSLLGRGTLGDGFD